MALFGLKKEKGTEKKAAKSAARKGTKASAPRAVSLAPHESKDRNLSTVLLSPRISEKSVGQNEQGVYTFVVRRDATKYDVRDAVALLFKVTPRKVTIVNRVPRRARSASRGRNVIVPGLKKASVFLEKGDRIDLV